MLFAAFILPVQSEDEGSTTLTRYRVPSSSEFGPVRAGPVDSKSSLEMTNSGHNFNGYESLALRNNTFSIDASRPLVQGALCLISLQGVDSSHYIRWTIDYQAVYALNDFPAFQIQPGSTSPIPIYAAVFDDSGYLGSAGEVFQVSSSGTCM